MKKDVRENLSVSALNLYKRAKNGPFRGIWLPHDHQSKFLMKLRRIRNYEIREKKNVNKTNPIARVAMKDVAASPLQSMILQRKDYSSNKNSRNIDPNGAVFVSNSTHPSSSTIATISPIVFHSATPSHQSLISMCKDYSTEVTNQEKKYVFDEK